MKKFAEELEASLVQTLNELLTEVSHGSVAKSVRQNKEAHPEKYCANKKCLWSLRSGPCPKHGDKFGPPGFFNSAKGMD